MAETGLTALSALGGADLRIGENRIVERAELALVSLAAPMDGAAALAAALESAYGLSVPDSRISTVAGDRRIVRTAPDQFLLIFPHPAPDATKTVEAALGGAGYVVDLSDALFIVEISGAVCRAALERLCPIDVHADRFPVGAFAQTHMAHMDATLIRHAENRFQLIVARSSARSFLHHVETAFRNVVA